MESNLETQLSVEFDSLKSYMVDWCIRVVHIVQKNNYSVCRQSNCDHAFPNARDPQQNAEGYSEGIRREPKLELNYADSQAEDSYGNGVVGENMSLACAPSFISFAHDEGVTKTEMPSSSRCNMLVDEQAGISQLHQDAVTEGFSRHQSPGSRSSSVHGCQMNELFNVDGSIDPETREYARLLMSKTSMIAANSGGDDSLNGLGANRSGCQMRASPPDNLDALIDDISSGYGLETKHSADSELPSSSQYSNHQVEYQKEPGSECGLLDIKEPPVNGGARKKPRVARNATNEGKPMKLCDYCNRSFRDSYCVKRHIYSVHLDDKNFACELCPEKFKSKQGLESHTRKRHSVQSFLQL